MTTEVDLFGDEAEQPDPKTGAESASQETQPARKPRKKRRSLMADPIIQWMAIGAAGLVILWTAAMASSIAFGLSNPPAPRTAVERQLDMLESVVRAKPRSAQAWADYAKALITAKQYSAAEEAIERGLKVASEKSQILVQQSRLARERDDDDKALELARAAVKAAREEQGADSKMLEGSGSRARLAPKGLPGGLILIAEIQTDRQEWSEVINAWNSYLNIQPTDCAALVARGDAQAKLGDKKAAEQSYRQALAYIPDMPEALAGLKAIGAEAK